jgi:hypothetical protein
MNFSEGYQYPLNVDSPYSTGKPVKIRKGAHRNHVGRIMSATQSGTFFVQKSAESGTDRLDLIPYGPFCPDELELLG